ncbi:hypothetical protein ACGFLS_06535 [Streptomyces abikoensis]
MRPCRSRCTGGRTWNPPTILGGTDAQWRIARRTAYGWMISTLGP